MKQTMLSLTLILAAACGGNTDTDLETAFCAALESPTARTVSANRAADGAPDATDAARVDVMLVADGERFSGFVTYRPDEVGRFAFGLTHDIGLVIRDAAGQEVPIETAVTGATQCTALAVRYTAPLNQETYTLELGPSTAQTIGIVAEESDDDTQ